jgi:hypothetical protein
MGFFKRFSFCFKNTDSEKRSTMSYARLPDSPRRPWSQSWFRTGDPSGKLARWLEEGHNPNVTDSVGNTPVHWAAWFDQLDLLHLLQQHDADLNIPNIGGNTPLHLACYKKSTPCLLFLMEHNVPLTLNVKGHTARDITIQQNFIYLTVLLEQCKQQQAESLEKETNSSTPACPGSVVPIDRTSGR